VSVVHSDNEYGNHGFEILSSLASKYNVCFTATQRVNKEKFGDIDYDNVLRNISDKTDVHGECGTCQWETYCKQTNKKIGQQRSLHFQINEYDQ